MTFALCANHWAAAAAGVIGALIVFAIATDKTDERWAASAAAAVLVMLSGIVWCHVVHQRTKAPENRDLFSPR